MKQVLLLILLLCCTLTGKASTKIVLESDSLIKVLETLPYDECSQSNHQNRTKQPAMYPIFGCINERSIATGK